jgi:hypothetical protein
MATQTCEACGKQALRDIIVNFGNTVEHVPSMESQYDLYGTPLDPLTTKLQLHLTLIFLSHTLQRVGELDQGRPVPRARLFALRADCMYATFLFIMT